MLKRNLPNSFEVPDNYYSGYCDKCGTFFHALDEMELPKIYNAHICGRFKR